MWDYYEPPPKPFYKKAWFVGLVSTLGLLLVAALLFALVVRSDYRNRAAQFDMKKLEEMESASVIFDRNNQVLGRIFIQNRDTVSLADLPHELLQSVVAAEDNRFYSHGGVDYYGMFRAAVK